MRRTMLKSKIHRATITESDLHYVRSITIASDLLDAADIPAYEMVAVLEVDSRARFETYTIPVRRGSRQIKVNVGAVRLVDDGGSIVVISYASYDHDELHARERKVVHVDAENEIAVVDNLVSALAST